MCTINFRLQLNSTASIIGLDLIQYLQDSEETLPPTVTEREGPTTTNNDVYALQYSIRDRLAGYVPKGNYQDGGVWKDPDGPSWSGGGVAGTFTSTAGPVGTYVYWATDHGFNIDEHQDPTTTGVSVAANAYFTANPTFGFSEKTILASIQTPSNFLISADTLRGDKKLSRGSMTPQYLDAASNAVPYPGSGYIANNGQAAIVPRHREGLNTLYSDGHVKYKKPLQLWRSFTDNDFRTDPINS